MKKSDENTVSNSKGVILVIALVALLVAAIFLPALYFLIKNEQRWTLKQKKTSVAFHMAEQGLDRGIWKIQESDTIWDDVSTGTVIPGYNFDVIYISTDVKGALEGEYKIKLTSGSETSTVLIQSIGRDKTTDEVRSIEAYYTKTSPTAGLLARGGLQFKPHLYIYWGPIIDYGGNITGAASVPTDYPRIITKGGVTADTNGASLPNGHDFYSDWPDPATYNYNTYQSKLGNAPTIDFEGFKTLAKNCSVPALKKASGSGAATSTPTGSGYFTETVVMKTSAGGTYLLDCSTCVIYIDAGSAGTTSVDFQNTNSQIKVRALIMTGDFEPKMTGGDSVPDISARIPSQAKTEYLTSAGSTCWTSKGWTNGGSATLNPVRVKGYVYVGGNCSTSGAQDPIVYGAVDIAGNITINNMQVYYDEFVSTSILVMNATPQIQYWRESKLSW